MKIEIVYTENEQLWKMEDIAAAHGYQKTQECYWVQIFTNENGDSIVTTRENGELSADPVERLAAILAPAEDTAPLTRTTYQNHMSAAHACTTPAQADEVIRAAADDWVLSARQYENIRHVALAAAYAN